MPCDQDIKYITAKPLSRIENEFFLRLVKAEKEGFLTISLTGVSSSNTSLFKELQKLITSTGSSEVADAWNNERTSALKDAIDNLLAPSIERDLRLELELDSAKYVARKCQQRLEQHLFVKTKSF